MILTVKDLVKSFGKLKVMDNWNISVSKGERLVLIGPSGCGKTTFLRIIAGLDSPDSGEVIRHFKKLGFVFQEPRLIPWRNAYDNLKLVEEDERKIELVFELVKLRGFERYFPHQMSGGMKQRLNLARALIIDPDFMVFDEPFSSLDIKVKLEIMEDMMKIWDEKKFTLLMVTHDIKEAIYVGNRIIILSDKPSRILESVQINITNRDITCDEFLQVESKILKLMMKGCY